MKYNTKNPINKLFASCFTILLALAFLTTSCEKDIVQEAVLVQEDLTFQEVLKKIEPHLKAEDNKIIVALENGSAVGLSEAQFDNAVKYFNAVNESIPEIGYSAERLLEGPVKLQIETPKGDATRACIGKHDAEWSVTAAWAKVWLSSCDLTTGGQVACIGLLNGLPFPLSLARGTVCGWISSWIVSNTCPNGAYIYVNFDVDWGWTGPDVDVDFSASCQAAPCSGCCRVNSTLERNVLSNISLFTSKEIRGAGKDVIKLYIKHQAELNAIFESDDSRYAATQNSFNHFWELNKGLVISSFGNNTASKVSSEQIMATQALLDDLSLVVTSPELKSTIETLQANLFAFEGRTLIDGIKTLDDLDLELIK